MVNKDENIKKIFFYIKHLNIGGAERILIEILQNIDISKFKVELILRTKIPEENILINEIPKNIFIRSVIPDELAKKNIKYKEGKVNFFKKLYFKYLKTLIKKEEKDFFKKIEKENYDIGINFDADYTYIMKIKAEKYIKWIHNSLKERFKNDTKRLAQKGKELRNYDKIVVLCDDMLEDMKEIFTNLESKFVKIYNPFNFQRINEMSNDVKVLSKEQENFFYNTEYIVAVKRLEKNAKDFETLFKGFKIFKEKTNNQVKLLLLGDGPNRNYIEKLIEENFLRDDVILLGRTTNSYLWIKKSLFLVHSSKSEGFGNVLVEGMALGKAVISSNCPTGPREILEDGSSGILYPVGDYKQLALEIEKLYLDRELKKEYEKKALESVKRFDKNIIIKEIENMFIEKN